MEVDQAIIKVSNFVYHFEGAEVGRKDCKNNIKIENKLGIENAIISIEVISYLVADVVNTNVYSVSNLKNKHPA